MLNLRVSCRRHIDALCCYGTVVLQPDAKRSMDSRLGTVRGILANRGEAQACVSHGGVWQAGFWQSRTDASKSPTSERAYIGPMSSTIASRNSVRWAFGKS